MWKSEFAQVDTCISSRQQGPLRLGVLGYIRDVFMYAYVHF